MYKYFEIDKQTNNADLKKQYRELCKKLHPDKEGGSKAEFTQMTLEYEQILKQRSRKGAGFIKNRIMEELKHFYTKIEPGLAEYKPEFLEMYEAVNALAEVKVEEVFKQHLAKHIPAILRPLARKFIKRKYREGSLAVKSKIENL